MKTPSPQLNEQQFAATLHAHGILSAAFFGSYARGEATPESDLDVLVTYPAGTTLFDVMKLQDELEQVSGRKVDLVSQRHISPRLERRISADLKPLAIV
jgi:predicted nucleotidyltransferase